MYSTALEELLRVSKQVSQEAPQVSVEYIRIQDSFVTESESNFEVCKSVYKELLSVVQSARHHAKVMNIIEYGSHWRSRMLLARSGIDIFLL
jgi:hypothetical protein